MGKDLTEIGALLIGVALVALLVINAACVHTICPFYEFSDREPISFSLVLYIHSHMPPLLASQPVSGSDRQFRVLPISNPDRFG